MTDKDRICQVYVNYNMLDGRVVLLEDLSEKEGKFLWKVLEKVREKPEWTKFAIWWNQEFNKDEMPWPSVVWNIRQDLESRIGIREGKVASPVI